MTESSSSLVSSEDSPSPLTLWAGGEAGCSRWSTAHSSSRLLGLKLSMDRDCWFIFRSSTCNYFRQNISLQEPPKSACVCVLEVRAIQTQLKLVKHFQIKKKKNELHIFEDAVGWVFLMKQRPAHHSTAELFNSRTSHRNDTFFIYGVSIPYSRLACLSWQ